MISAIKRRSEAGIIKDISAVCIDCSKIKAHLALQVGKLHFDVVGKKL